MADFIWRADHFGQWYSVTATIALCRARVVRTISSADLQLFHSADSPEAAVEILRESFTEGASVAGPEVPAISSSAKPQD